MQDLIELISQLNLKKLRTSDLWSSILEPGSKMEQLFDFVESGRADTVADAATLIFENPKAIAKVQNLKARLRDRLIDIVFLLDFRDQALTDRQKAYFECNKKWSASMILLSKNIKITSIELLERLLKLTSYFEFTEITLNILYNLRLHYGTIQSDQVKYELYRNQYSQYQKIWMEENNAEELYTHYVSHYLSANAEKEILASKALEYYERVRPDMETNTSFRLHLCGRLLHLMVFISSNDYIGAAKVCEDAIAFFEAKDYNSSLPMQAFYYQLVVCYVQLREFEKGEEIVSRYQSIYEEGSYNWFKLQELFFLLSMHTRHYAAAFNTYALVAQHPRLAAQPNVIKETWKLYEAYVHYLIFAGKIVAEPSASFKVGKFLNEVPVFSQDKRGMNIPILIVQILFMFAEGRYGQSIDRIEAIEKYCSRYLKKNDNFRSNSFIKMLLQIPEAGFHKVAAERKSSKYLDMLKSVPMEISNQTHGIEIIPYEDLWDMTIELLKMK